MNKRMLALLGKKKKTEKKEEEKKEKEGGKPKRKKEKKEKPKPRHKPKPKPVAQVSKAEEEKEDTGDGSSDGAEDGVHRDNSRRLPSTEKDSTPAVRGGGRRSREGKRDAGASGDVDTTRPEGTDAPEPPRSAEYNTLRTYGSEINAKKACHSYLWVISHCAWCLGDGELILGEVGKRGGTPTLCSKECAEAQRQYYVVVLGAKSNGAKEEEEEEKEEKEEKEEE